MGEKSLIKKWVIRITFWLGIVVLIGQVRTFILKEVAKAENRIAAAYERQLVRKKETVFLYPGDTVYVRVNPQNWEFEPQNGEPVLWIGLTNVRGGDPHPIYPDWILDFPNDRKTVTRRMAPHHIIGLRYPTGHSTAKFVAVVVETTLPRNESLVVK